MKKTVIAKLRSNSGASLMAALLFFIMTATVGSIILAAATASSGRLAGLKRNEQAHYAVNSAAEVLSGLIQDENSKVILQITKEYPSENTTRREFISPKTGTTLSAYESITSQHLLPYLVKNAYPLLSYDSSFPDADSLSLPSEEIEVGVNGQEDLKVKATFKLDASLNLIVEIEPAATGISNPENITLRFKPVLNTTEQIAAHDMKETVVPNGADNRIYAYLKTYTISWTDPVVE